MCKERARAIKMDLSYAVLGCLGIMIIVLGLANSRAGIENNFSFAIGIGVVVSAVLIFSFVLLTYSKVNSATDLGDPYLMYNAYDLIKKHPGWRLGGFEGKSRVPRPET